MPPLSSDVNGIAGLVIPSALKSGWAKLCRCLHLPYDPSAVQPARGFTFEGIELLCNNCANHEIFSNRKDTKSEDSNVFSAACRGFARRKNLGVPRSLAAQIRLRRKAGHAMISLGEKNDEPRVVVL
jgi:hypothetical protein